jgi:preprotein translocase subunit SecE
MANEGTSTLGAFWRDLFSTGLYKRSQGRIARQVTFGVLAVVVVLGAWSLLEFMTDKTFPLISKVFDPTDPVQKSKYDTVNGVYRYFLPMAVFFGGMWMAFRVVNWPRFADFLIAVEAEMNKVSWPTRTEMIRSSIVVMITIFGLAFVLLFYDLFWQTLLRFVGVLPGGGG